MKLRSFVKNVCRPFLIPFQFVATACLSLLLIGCGDASGHFSNDDRLKVLATTTMIEDLARVIGGQEVEVVGLMKTGEDPHVYDVKPKDATAIQRADLVLVNGLHLEATLDAIVAEQASGLTVALAEQDGITPIIGKDGLDVAPDPHCWMDIDYYKLYTAGVRDALIQLAPEHEAVFTQRAEAYLQELDELQVWIVEQFNTVPEAQRVIVTGHDAFAYFGKAYGIEVHGLIGISTEQEPKPQDIESLKQLIKDKGIRAIFPESSLGGSTVQLIQTIAKETGASVGEALHSDSLGQPGSGAGTYIGMMKHNTSTMVEALKGGIESR